MLDGLSEVVRSSRRGISLVYCCAIMLVGLLHAVWCWCDAHMGVRVGMRSFLCLPEAGPDTPAASNRHAHGARLA